MGLVALIAAAVLLSQGGSTPRPPPQQSAPPPPPPGSNVGQVVADVGKAAGDLVEMFRNLMRS